MEIDPVTQEFLDSLEAIIDWYDRSRDIDCFKLELAELADEYRHIDLVNSIIDIFNHNYKAIKYGKTDAIINSFDQWVAYNKKGDL